MHHTLKYRIVLGAFVMAIAVGSVTDVAAQSLREPKVSWQENKKLPSIEINMDAAYSAKRAADRRAALEEERRQQVREAEERRQQEAEERAQIQRELVEVPEAPVVKSEIVEDAPQVVEEQDQASKKQLAEQERIRKEEARKRAEELSRKQAAEVKRKKEAAKKKAQEEKRQAEELARQQAEAEKAVQEEEKLPAGQPQLSLEPIELPVIDDSLEVPEVSQNDAGAHVQEIESAIEQEEILLVEEEEPAKTPATASTTKEAPASMTKAAKDVAVADEKIPAAPKSMKPASMKKEPVTAPVQAEEKIPAVTPAEAISSPPVVEAPEIPEVKDVKHIEQLPVEPSLAAAKKQQEESGFLAKAKSWFSGSKEPAGTPAPIIDGNKARGHVEAVAKPEVTYSVDSDLVSQDLKVEQPIILNIPPPPSAGDALSIASMYEKKTAPVPMPSALDTRPLSQKKAEAAAAVVNEVDQALKKQVDAVVAVDSDLKQGNLPPPQSILPTPLSEKAPQAEKKAATEVVSLPVTPAKAPSTGLLASVAFDKDESELSAEDKAALADVVQQLKSDSSKRLSIVGYASNAEDKLSTARRVSLKRALAVRTYIIDQGIESTRLNVQALGNVPVDGASKDQVNVFLIGGVS